MGRLLTTLAKKPATPTTYNFMTGALPAALTFTRASAAWILTPPAC